MGGVSFLKIEVEERLMGPNAVKLELGEPILPQEVLLKEEGAAVKEEFRLMLTAMALELRTQERIYEDKRLKSGSSAFDPASG